MNQHLNCYNALVDAAKAMPSLLANIPRGDGYLVDQLKRAMASAILNLAEGNARYSAKERNRFFDFSCGSISECLGGIDILSAFGYIDLASYQILINNLRKAYYMIRKLKK